MIADFRYGFRMLVKRPGTSLLAIVALGLGIGLTTTMFSIVQGAFLRGLPFEESERIIHLGRVNVTDAAAANPNIQAVPLDDLKDWREAQQSFEELAAFQQRTANVTGGLAPERYRAASLTPNALHVLRVAPIAGRDFTAADAEPGAPAVAIISYRVWQSQFRGDRAVVNQVVRVNGTPTTIIGVAPDKFGFPQAQDFWMPLTIKLPEKRNGGDAAQVFGRLKREVSLEQAQTEFMGIGQRLSSQYPENKDLRPRLTPYVRRFIGNQVISTLLAMLLAVFGVMLIACANVTNLQLARAAERTREIAVRTALGAGRLRIVRQLLVEGLMLAALGAGLGLGIAALGTGLFNRAIVDTVPPFWIDIRLDPTVLAFATGLTVIAALAASLLPAFRATRQDVNATLKDEGRANTGLHMGRFSRWLVVAEVLLSCCLLVVSGLMIKSVVVIGTVKYPYPASQIFVGNVSLDAKTYPKDEDRYRAFERIETALKSAPGARAVTLSTGSPENTGGNSIAIDGQTYAKPQDQPNVRRLTISPGYFDVLQVTKLQGRGFTSADTAAAPPVAIVSDDFVKKFYPDGNAIGRRIKIGTGEQAKWWTIVGVAPKLIALRDGQGNPETVYTPITQDSTTGITLLVLTGGDGTSFTSEARSAIATVDQDLVIGNPNSLAASYWSQTWAFRVFGSLFMSFGFAALVLASAGLYGVMAFSVRRRTQEIGVRMALGADRPGVVRMILWQGMWRVALGIALGIGPAWWLGGAMSQLLFNVTPTDVTVYSLTIGGLLLAGFLASVVPALRAASVDPLVALRRE